MTLLQRAVANVLLEIGAVQFRPSQPITFKSGIISPVYVDNRTIPFHPTQWRLVIDSFAEIIAFKQLDSSVIAGIEAAGIPHSAALAYSLSKPSVFVRKQPKEHGTQRRIEGGEVTGLSVLLIEDLVSTGGSSLSGIEALRAEGAVVNHCLAIVSYNFSDTIGRFVTAGVELHTLTTFSVILEQATAQKRYNSVELDLIQDWLNNPRQWASKHGFST